MDTQQIIGLIGFAFVSSITPGPNNLMLMASGVNFGIRRTLPHMLGISIGFMILILTVGIGLVELFDTWPPAYTILGAASADYLLWLAWKIANAPLPETGEYLSNGNPMTFMQAALFQWINPKAWTMPVHDFETTYSHSGLPLQRLPDDNRKCVLSDCSGTVR
ncbi:MAG: LysE family translocator [Pseudoruegeria sp.]